MVGVAGATVSFGVFELAAHEAVLPRSEEVLDGLAAGRFDGIDLGPPGYLGGPKALSRNLDDRGLALAGGYIPLRLTEERSLPDDLRLLEEILDLLEAGAGTKLPPRPTLADAGAAHRSRSTEAGASLDDAGWETLLRNLDVASARCRVRGLEPSFHHHIGTWIQTPPEIERLLGSTDIDLCLDSGHLLLAGGDPVTAVGEWGDRITHLHVKDARLDVLQRAATMKEVWSRGAFCPLGSGDVDVAGFVGALQERGYQGWVV
ncbi:MAG: sugar phosphate isomerase/epimerase family protein, partial [Actinomycetota bacterium]